MALPLLIVRPEPGASATKARADALGLPAIVAPLFAVAPLSWTPPPAQDSDALLLTSANAARLGGAGLENYATLPCLCVGEATADAARAAGLNVLWVGHSDGGTALKEAAAQGLHRLLWLSGQQHTPLVHPQISLTVVPVYHAEEGPPAPALLAALKHPAIALLHSQRAAWRFAELVGHDLAVRARIGLITISPGVAAVAGEGWAWMHWPENPRDQDMLELVRAMCQNMAP